jgi:aconitase B
MLVLYCTAALLHCSRRPCTDLNNIYPYEGKVCAHGTDTEVSSFELKTDVILDEGTVLY